MCVARVVSSWRDSDHSMSCRSAGGRSLFLANNVTPSAVAGPSATSESHITADDTRSMQLGMLTAATPAKNGREPAASAVAVPRTDARGILLTSAELHGFRGEPLT